MKLWSATFPDVSRTYQSSISALKESTLRQLFISVELYGQRRGGRGGVQLAMADDGATETNALATSSDLTTINLSS